MTIFLVSGAPTTTSQPRTFSNMRFCLAVLSQTLHHNFLGVDVSNMRFLCLAFLSQTWHHNFLGFCNGVLAPTTPSTFLKISHFILQFSSNLLHHNFVLSGFGTKTTLKQMFNTTLAITIIESPSFPSIHQMRSFCIIRQNS
jgi:hypothetical protein